MLMGGVKYTRNNASEHYCLSEDLKSKDAETLKIGNTWLIPEKKIFDAINIGVTEAQENL